MVRAAWTLRRSERGMAAVEMALVAPVLLIVLLGTVDFGRSMYTALCLSQAATAGADYGAQDNDKTFDYSGMESVALQAGRDLGSGITAEASRICKCPGDAVVDCATGICAGYGSPRLYVQVITRTTFRTVVDYPGVPASVEIARTAVKRVR